MPADDPLAEQERVSLAEVQDRRFAMILNEWTDGPALREQIRSSYGIRLNVAFYLNNIAPLAQFVRRGRCLGIVRRDAYWEEHMRYVALREISPRLSGTISLCYDRESLLSPQAAAFIDLIHRRKEEKDRQEGAYEH